MFVVHPLFLKRVYLCADKLLIAKILLVTQDSN